MISEKRTIASKCLRLVSLIDRNLYFGVTSSVLLGHHCRFSGAQKCSCLGAKVPLPWHKSALPYALFDFSETRISAWRFVL